MFIAIKLIKIMKKYLIYSLLIGLVLISCKSQKEQPKTEEPVKVKAKENVPKFNMMEIEGTYEVFFMQEMEQIEGEKPYITIQESGNISGINGCNTYYGRILQSSKEESLFDKLGSTRMACEGIKADVERVFMNTMAEITDVRVAGENEIEFLINGLVVMKGKKVVLREQYKIQTFNGKDVNSVGMIFNVSELRMNGNTGCNSFSAQLIQDGFKLDISEISATELACEDFDSKLESEYLSQLQLVNRYKIIENIYSFYQGNKLIFTAIKE